MLPIVLIDNNIKSSNGIAAGSSFEMASNNALSELIERDLFFGHYITQTPAYRLNKKETLLNSCSLLDALIKFNDQHNIKTEIFSLGEALGYNVIAIFCYGESATFPFGMTMGLGSKASLEQSLEAAAIECLRATTWLMSSDNIHSINLKQFEEIQAPKIKDHGKLSLNLEYTTEFRKHWQHTEENEDSNKNYDPKIISIEVEELFIDQVELKDLPLKFARAQSRGLQSPFYGSLTSEKLNIQRLLDFRECFNPKQLQLLAHPMC